MGTVSRADDYQRRHRWAGCRWRCCTSSATIRAPTLPRRSPTTGSWRCSRCCCSGHDPGIRAARQPAPAAPGAGLRASPVPRHRRSDHREHPLLPRQHRRPGHRHTGLRLRRPGHRPGRPDHAEQGVGRAARLPPEPGQGPAAEPAAAGLRRRQRHRHHGAVRAGRRRGRLRRQPGRQRAGARDRGGGRAERNAVHRGVPGADRPSRHHPGDPRRRNRRRRDLAGPAAARRLLLAQKLKGATATYGELALVLGLLAWIYLGAVTAVDCAELNAVRAERLWPRSLLTPFTDNAELTLADQRAYTSYARTERHKSFENIDVSFGAPPHQSPRSQNPERHPSGR